MENTISPIYEQRDIVLIPFPYSDLTGSKLRPALILSNQTLNTTEDRICCLITSNQPENGILINSFEQGTLPFKSWIKPHRLFTINEKIIKKRLCRIHNTLHEKTIKYLNEYIDTE